jgi:hypothetical protein
VKAHVFLCLLAYYVEWHMRQRLAPLLFDGEELEEVVDREASVVVPVKRKGQRKRTGDNFPRHSFRTLLTDLSTIVKNRIQPKLPGVEVSFDKITNPTLLQERALGLLGVSLFV